MRPSINDLSTPIIRLPIARRLVRFYGNILIAGPNWVEQVTWTFLRFAAAEATIREHERFYGV